ncbi:hypothetical protein [Microvirga tunisiensis]|uniref:Uncharacterized protein n=1 Tax=Microvirga tunisiensis TaxID=2108360 RepID=A0A5N7MGX8_9HYPH|nr:hypothetical protein [Microvirga tunisiensis]MPR06199.1 hypothetical protein [Microvirga tunisiensis]MPR26058.1 hypothetical protein [Microvirga tunisiensis]
MAEKPQSHPTDEPRPATKAKSMGEALDEIGFVPLDPPRRIIVREDHAQEPLTRWRKPKGQN